MPVYEILWGLAAGEQHALADGFSFRSGRFRRALEESLEQVNGQHMVNKKKFSIIEEQTTDTRLAIRLESQQRLEVPTRACKALSRQLARTEFAELLTYAGPDGRGKLLVGLSWKEVPSPPGERTMDGPEMMAVLTRMLMRNSAKDAAVLEQIKHILLENSCGKGGEGLACLYPTDDQLDSD